MKDANSRAFDPEYRDRIRRKISNDFGIDLSEDQITLCIMEEEETKLSVWHGQVWPNLRRFKKKVVLSSGRVEWQSKERITWSRTIDGLRSLAAMTGELGGVEAPEFVEETGADGQLDLLCRVTVWRGELEFRNSYVGEARYSEFVQLVDEWSDNRKTGKKTPNGTWAHSPRNQLAIAAERQALRRAFPAGLSVGVAVADPRSTEKWEKEFEQQKSELELELAKEYASAIRIGCGVDAVPDPADPADPEPAGPEPAETIDPAEAKATGGCSSDVENEMMEQDHRLDRVRSRVVPLLAKWCENIHGEKVSFRRAFEVLSGEARGDEYKMSHDDYVWLGTTLKDILSDGPSVPAEGEAVETPPHQERA